MKVLFVAGFLYASLLPAITITNTTVCEPEQPGLGTSGVSPTYGTTQCGAQLGDPSLQPPDDLYSRVSAGSHGSFDLAGNQVTVSLSQFTSDPGFNWNGSYSGSLSISSYATATGSVSAEFTTPGPVRQGYLMAYTVASGGNYGGYTANSSSVAIGNYGTVCSVLGCAQGWPFSERKARVNMFPFTLGEPFSFSAVGSSFAENTPNDPDGVTEGNIDSTTVFELFEADQSTPVDLVEVPQPSSIGLIGVAVGLLAAMLGKRAGPPA